MTTRYFNVKQGITTGNVTIDAASSNVTGVGNLTVVGNAIAAFVGGDGYKLSNIAAGNISGQVSNATVAGTVYSSAQPNITSVGTLTGLTSTGIIDLTGASNVALGAVGNVHITGGTSGQYLQTDGSGALSWQTISSTSITNGNSNVSVAANGNVTIGSTGNANVVVVSGAGANVTGYLNVAGNIYATNFIGNISGNISGNLTIPGANTGVVFNDGGNANSSTAFTFDKTTNLVTITANANIGNISTGGVVSATGNVSGGNLTTGGVVSATGNVSGGNLTTGGVLSVTGNANVGNLGTGGLITATGNITGGNLVTTGTANIGNLKISGIVEGNLIPSSSNTYSLGNSTNYWKDLFLSGTTITIGTQTISANSSGVSLSNTAFLTTLDVTGNANVGNLITGGVVSATGNVSGGNLTTDGQVVATGNVSGGNLTTGGVLSVTGNANVGNLGTGGLITATGNVSGGNLSTGGALSVTGNANVVGQVTAGNIITHLITAPTTDDLELNAGTGNANIVLVPTGNGTVDVSSKRITQVGYPTSDTDAATKQYVDSVAQGLDVKASVHAATTAALSAYTYNNGTSGVGATITANANGALVVDGHTMATGERVLVKNETSGNAPYNGIYVVTATGDGSNPFVLTRSTDFDNGTPSGEIPGAFTFVEMGSTNSDTGWVCTTNSPVVVGTTVIAFSQFSGAGQYAAGDGLALTGTTFSVNVDNTTIEISADALKVKDSANFVTPNIGIASGTSLTTSGNVSANNLSATNDVGAVTGSFTGNVTAANVYANSGTIGANLVTGNLLTGTVTTNAQPNITSVGTLSSLAVTANVTAGNVYANSGTIGANVVTGNLLTGTITTNAQPNVTSVGTLTGLTVSGVTNLGPASNVIITGGTSGYILSTNGSGNLTWVSAGSSGIAGSNTQVQFNDGGSYGASANFTFDKTTNTLSATNISGNGAGLTSLTGANVTGQVGNALVASTVYTNAQPNITSVGSLTGLTVSNATGVVDFTTTANVTLGNVSNLHVSGGSNGQYLKTDGSGALSWATIDSSAITNGNSNVNIPTANGNVNISSAGNANVLIVTGTGFFVNGDGNVTGNLTAGNIISGAGAGGNITGANLISANYFQGNGNLLTSLTGANVDGQVGNALVAGTVYTAAQPNITSVGTLTSLTVSGNVSANFIALNNGLTSNRSNVSVTSNTVIDQFAKTSFRTAKYVISASGDDGYQSLEALLVHDGTSAYITIYGSVCSNVSADIIDVSANINGVSANVSLYATSSSANAKVNIVASYINV